MTNGRNVRVGFAYEREVKQHFIDAGWGCARAAHSASEMDLIAWSKNDHPNVDTYLIFSTMGYEHKISNSKKIPLMHLASKIEEKYIKHVYWEVVRNDTWAVVLMQCKIKKR